SPRCRAPVSRYVSPFLFFFFTVTSTTETYTLSLHDALPICMRVCPPTRMTSWMSFGVRPASCIACRQGPIVRSMRSATRASSFRSEEHTSELQSPDHLVCRLLLEKKKNKKHDRQTHSITNKT